MNVSITPFLSTQGVLSFLIVNTNSEAFLIDPSFEMAQKIVLKLKQEKLKLKYILETHTHADFFSSRRLFKSLYPEAKIGLSYASPTKDNELNLKDLDKIEISKAVNLTCWQSPGHTNESMVYVLYQEQNLAAFTGDTLLIGGSGRTDFQLGEAEELYYSLEKILNLPDSTIIYPGHNYNGQTRTVLGVEKITNPRLKLVLEKKKSEFIKLMNSHIPPSPDLFEESLLWNSI